MPRHVEKSVFISYRRTNGIWTQAIYQDLTNHGYDVFYDLQGIDSGDFSQLIVENIKGRSHFLILLTPSALEQCGDPNDWLRREIETAIDTKRNIVPLMLESFDFGSPGAKKALTGKLALLKNYNGLRIYSEYFEEGMKRLRERYLNVSLDSVLHPISRGIELATKAQQKKAKKTKAVQKRELTAQEWYERGYQNGENKNYEEEIRCYTEAIRIHKKFPNAFFNRGLAKLDQNDLKGAIADFSSTIRLTADDAAAYYHRGIAYSESGNFNRAIEDFSKVINFRPNFEAAYYNRGLTYENNNYFKEAIRDYRAAIQRKPNYGLAIISIFIVLNKLGKSAEAQKYEKLAFELIKGESEYNQACFESRRGNIIGALALLKVGLEKGLVTKAWARKDPDFENIRDNPRFTELVRE